MVDDQGAVRMEVCERRDKDTFQGLILRNIAPGSIIHSDSWRAYHGLNALGYQHSTVNHSIEFVAQDGTYTQKIESHWRALRRMFSPGGRRHDDIADYLVEFLWRQKCRRDGLDPFPELIKILRTRINGSYLRNIWFGWFGLAWSLVPPSGARDLLVRHSILHPPPRARTYQLLHLLMGHHT